MSRLESTLRRIVECLQAREARFAVVGGIAVSARTEPRFTRDADVCVSVDDDTEAEALVRDLQGEAYEVLALVEQEAAGRLATARLSDIRSGEVPGVVDLLFASSGIEKEIVAGAEMIDVFEGFRAPVATVPALLALKVLARDDAKRPQDRVDALALLSVSTPKERDTARDLLRRIEDRGFARGRELVRALDGLIAEADGE